MRQWAPAHRHPTSLCGPFLSLCGHFASLCGHFVSLCGRVVSLCSRFVSLCGRFVSLCGHLSFCVSLWSFCVSLWLFERKQQPHLHMIILFMLSTPEQTSIHHSSIHRKEAGSVRSHERQHNNVSQFIPLIWTYLQLDPCWMEIRYCPPDVASLVCIIACYDDPFSTSLSAADEVSKSDDEEWMVIHLQIHTQWNTFCLQVRTSSA